MGGRCNAFMPKWLTVDLLQEIFQQASHWRENCIQDKVNTHWDAFMTTPTRRPSKHGSMPTDACVDLVAPHQAIRMKKVAACV